VALQQQQQVLMVQVAMGLVLGPRPSPLLPRLLNQTSRP
jgi:hypothetical protein